MKSMKKRVLVVDDDAAVRESVRKVLEAANYDVVLAADGNEVDESLPEGIDLVLLDLNLPSLNGWDIFERLTTQHPFLPVIIITGMPNQYKTARIAGVGALMEKPIEPPALLKTMDDLLAEPHRTRLRRVCGYLNDTRYMRPSNAPAVGKLRERAITPQQRFRTSHSARKREK